MTKHLVKYGKVVKYGDFFFCPQCNSYQPIRSDGEQICGECRLRKRMKEKEDAK